jgi:zinc transport system substrate-binding protein
MRSHLAPFLVAVLGAAPAQSAELPLRVVTSIPPLAMIAAELGGDRVLVHSLLPPGADAHTFEPKPSDAAALADADVVISLGSAIDDWLGETLEAPAGAQVVVLDPPSRDIHAHAHAHEDEHAHGAKDPHVWLDPAWVRERAVAPIHRALATADPAGAPRYGVAARATSEKLSNMEDDIREALARAQTRSFFAWHPAWGTFAARFGLHTVGSVGEGEGREPSLYAMVAAVRAAKAAGVRAVLVEPQTDPRHARVLADELGVPLVTVDPLGDAWSADRATYPMLMRFNTTAFAKALGVPKEEDEKPAPISAMPSPVGP